MWPVEIQTLTDMLSTCLVRTYTEGENVNVVYKQKAGRGIWMDCEYQTWRVSMVATVSVTLTKGGQNKVCEEPRAVQLAVGNGHK